MNSLLSIKKIKSHSFDMINMEKAAENILNYGMLSVRSVNKTLQDASSRPNPRDLYWGLWHEGETGCLFADSGTGKSILAVQMGMEIAETDKVLYIDCELSDKQFQLRYTSEEGELAEFPDNFFRCEINPDAIYEGDFESTILASIEECAIGIGAAVIIVDNLTYLCNDSEKGDKAGAFMRNLLRLKKKYGWSLLVIAHTPKRDLWRPLTANNLAGSKKLYNLFDCIFALGRSASENQIRYLKQFKVRVCEERHGADNVIVFELKKDGAMTRLEHIGFGKESDYLADIPSDGSKVSTSDKIYEAIEEEVQYRHGDLLKIAEGLGINPNSAKVTISRMVRKGLITQTDGIYMRH